VSRQRIVFFDSGDTLLRPVGAEWWPKPRTRELMSPADLPVPDDDRLLDALATGKPYLASQQLVPSLDSELATYVSFYEIVLASLFTDFPERMPYELAEAAVFELDQEPFEDTVAVLERLERSGTRMGVVSNAGPSLELRHRDVGIRRFFEPFVLSDVVGARKPAHRIYQLALEEAALAPEDAVFVDDRPENVRAAITLGMAGFVIDRNGAYLRGLPSVADLTELADLVA
jgi:putative hydrolase of the HAD superfamily